MEGNKLVDLLANIGVDAEDGFFEGTIASLNCRDQIAQIQEIVAQEQTQTRHKHLDVGDRPLL